MHPKFVLRAVILAVLVALATCQECSHEDKEGYIIDVHTSEKNGAVFMSDAKTLTKESCQNACCNLEEDTLDDGSLARCNLAVFHSSNEIQSKSKNCFLVFCPSKNSCHLTRVKGFTSSYVTHKTTEASTLLPEINSTLPLSTREPTPSPDEASSESTSSISTNSSKDLVPSSPMDFLGENSALNQTNLSAADQQDSEDEDDSSTKSIIASNGALIAALCFGVIFLLAVVVLLGKHWYEAYQRRHYSKVDYLINGMYN
ncbi:MANSC domain-containing protein 1-like isoform X2 [Acanthaster planci]|uniref:MANSC domain-containing protein 1-like isoform X2 n=1 Tax=Acanthaster planci TaxID=133434 RepID=A0A8B7XF19_ACAPL|nr:MANSC domain-containing protein 1-like isoform X2 [Acanthaster planci]